MSRSYGFYDKELQKVVWYDADQVDQHCRELREQIQAPMVITDTMDPIRFQGLHYESKRAYEQAVTRQGFSIKSEKDIPGSPFDLSTYNYHKDGITKPIDTKEIEADTEFAQAKAVEGLRDGTIQLTPEQQQAAKDINQIYTQRTGKSATIIKDRSCQTIKKSTEAS